MSDQLDSSLDMRQRPKLLPLQPKFTFAFISIICTVVFTIIFLWLYYSLLSSLPFKRFGVIDSSREAQREFALAASQYVVWVGLTGFLQFAAFVCGAVSISMFYYRAYSNLYTCEIKGLTFSPGMAVGWFYIPLVNLVMPLIVSNQLWKASRLVKNGNYDGTWQNERTNPKIIFWYISFAAFILWYFYCISRIMSAAMVMSTEYGPDAFMNRELMAFNAMISFFKLVFIGFGISITLQGLFMILFTKEITEAQDQATAQAGI
ncbi:MAG TPA: DUF4328 domain-containing protein [Flavobacteriales bacterium]|nr:DUF4328 domain-containing protein [Flavobacteriales bacterium]